MKAGNNIVSVCVACICLLARVVVVQAITTSVVLHLEPEVHVGQQATYTCVASGKNTSSNDRDPTFSWSIRDTDVAGTLIKDLSSIATLPAAAAADNDAFDGEAKSQVILTMESAYLNKRIWCGAIDYQHSNPSIQIFGVIYESAPREGTLGTYCVPNVANSCRGDYVTCTTSTSTGTSTCTCQSGFIQCGSACIIDNAAGCSYVHAVVDSAHLCDEITSLDCGVNYIKQERDEVLCGSDGKTYNNFCYYSQARCATPTTHVVGVGACGATQPPITTMMMTAPASTRPRATATSMPPTMAASTVPTTTLPPTTTIDHLKEVFCQSKDSLSCPTDLDPICGSDKNFYLNKCEFSKATCDNPLLTTQTIAFCTGGSGR